MKTRLANENFRTDWVDNLLRVRGITDEQMERIKRPTVDLLNDPLSMTNMYDAAALLVASIKENKKLGLLIDCD